MWDLDTAGPSNLNINFVPDDPPGTFDFSRLADYGMDYDPVRDVFVLWGGDPMVWVLTPPDDVSARSAEHTSELQSLMSNSYSVFCFKKKIQVFRTDTNNNGR